MSIVFNNYFVTGMNMLYGVQLAVVVWLCVLAIVKICVGFNWRTCCRVYCFDGGELFMVAK